MSVEINSECENFSVLSVKLTDDADGCIVAYGSSKSVVAFKHVVIISSNFVFTVSLV